MTMLLASLPPARKRHTSALKSGGRVELALATTGWLAGLAAAPMRRSCESADNMPVAPTAAQHWPRNLRRDGSEFFVGEFIRENLWLDRAIGRSDDEVDRRVHALEIVGGGDGGHGGYCGDDAGARRWRHRAGAEQ